MRNHLLKRLFYIRGSAVTEYDNFLFAKLTDILFQKRQARNSGSVYPTAEDDRVILHDVLDFCVLGLDSVEAGVFGEPIGITLRRAVFGCV